MEPLKRGTRWGSNGVVLDYARHPSNVDEWVYLVAFNGDEENAQWEELSPWGKVFQADCLSL